LAALSVAALAVALLYTPVLPAAAAGEGVRPPQDLRAWDRPDDAGGMVELAWSPSPDPDILYYQVYRADSQEGPFLLAGRHCTESEVNFLGWIDVGLEDGHEYFYRVTAVSRDGRESAPSAAVAATPSAQVFRQAFKTSKSITISLAEQRLYCIENGRVAMVFRCSTGRPGDATPPGTYSILYHVYEMPIARYPGTVCYYWMGFAPDYGIHGWPTYNGSTSDTSAIGSPASHGCVRLLPDEAPTVYYWAPDGIPVNIVEGPFVPPTPPIDGGTVSLGATAPSSDWYFAEGYTAEDFDEYLLILNPSDQPTEVEVDYLLPDSRSVSHSYGVAPRSRFTVHVDEVPGLEATEISVRLHSPVPVMAERAMYFDYHGRQDGHDSLGATAPSTQWYFAEGYTAEDFDEYICLLNPQDAEATVQAFFQTEAGQVIEHVKKVPARSRQTVHVDEVPGLEACASSSYLVSDLPVVAERAMYFDYHGCKGGHCTVGSTALSTGWELAEGYTGGSFDQYVLIQNPGTNPARAAVSIFKEGGETLELQYDLLPLSRFTLHVDEVPGCENAALSMKIDGGVTPLLVERAMYFNQEGRDGGHVGMGAPGPSTDWYFAEGYTAQSFDSFILLENPHPVLVAHVDLALMPPGLGASHFAFTVPPRSRVTVPVDDLDGFSSIEFSAQVSSDVPVVAERAVYFCILR
jgi:hypothetical protein